jgi:putative membrane protein
VLQRDESLTDPTPRTDAGRPAFGRAVLRRLPLVGTILGLGLALWLVATNDLGAVAEAFGRIGLPGLVAIVLVRAAVIALCGLAWARILEGLSAAQAGAFITLRFVREGINVLLPVASVGGDLVGGRLLTFRGVAGTLAAASILVDMLMQVATQALFALGGVALLARVEGEAAARLAGWTLQALLVTGLVLAAFFAFQRTGALRGIERRLADLGRRFVRDGGSPGSDSGGVQASLDRVWDRSRRGHLAQSFVLHLAAWVLGAVEIWIALACIGIENVGFAEALVIEALSQAIKSAAFPVPSGLGVQEGGFVLLGALFGIDAGTALALSLAKRVPDVVLGLPALLVWQNLEARRSS